MQRKILVIIKHNHSNTPVYSFFNRYQPDHDQSTATPPTTSHNMNGADTSTRPLPNPADKNVDEYGYTVPGEDKYGYHVPNEDDMRRHEQANAQIPNVDRNGYQVPQNRPVSTPPSNTDRNGYLIPQASPTAGPETRTQNGYLVPINSSGGSMQPARISFVSLVYAFYSFVLFIRMILYLL